MDVTRSDAAPDLARHEGPRKAYDAFISYAHEGDKGFAAALQRGLQHLAKPWNRRRAMEVFRDETSLSASPGLEPSLRDALGASRWLVLLASPEAAASRWVHEEIMYWVSSKGADHLLIVVTDGTWIWDGDVGDLSPASTAWNRTLRGVFAEEPLYVDMTWARRNADLTLRNPTFRDQVATLAAAIKEIPKEDIEGEDVRQQHRTRRLVRTVIATLTVLVLLASGLAIWANFERLQAIDQRNVAASGELSSNSEAIGETNATVSKLDSLAAWGIDESAQARYAMLSAAASPEIAALTGGSGAVSSVAFSPDGRILATGDDDGTARLWNVATWQQIRSLTVGPGPVKLAFSPDGKTLATGDLDGTVDLWNVATGRRFASMTVQSTSFPIIDSVAFSPDGKTLATGVADGTARLWNIATRRQIRSLNTNSDTVNSVAFSPDGKTLATGDDNGTARLWDAATGRQITSLNSGSPTVWAVAFSPDGKTLATADLGGMAELWDLASNRQVSSLPTGAEDVDSVAFSRDGTTLATGADNGLALWNPATGREIGTAFTSLGTVESVAFSPDGKTLATGNDDGAARVWDVTGGQTGGFPASGPGQSVAFSPDGKTLATGDDDGAAELWNVATGKQITSLVTGSDQVWSVAFSPDGKILATGDDNGTAELWNVATGKQITSITVGSDSSSDATNGADAVSSVAFSPDGKTLATGGGGSPAQALWKTATGQQIRSPDTDSSAFTSVAFSPDGKTLATGDDNGAAELWNVPTGRQIASFNTGSDTVYSVALSPDGKTLATGDVNGTARLWDVATRQQTASFNTGSDTVYSVAFSPDGKTLATGGDDGTARLWDVATRQQIGAALDASGPVKAVAFSPDGRTLATDGKTLQTWNVGYVADVLSQLCSQVGGSLTQAEWAQLVPSGPAYTNVCQRSS